MMIMAANNGRETGTGTMKQTPNKRQKSESPPRGSNDLVLISTLDSDYETSSCTLAHNAKHFTSNGIFYHAALPLINQPVYLPFLKGSLCLSGCYTNCGTCITLTVRTSPPTISQSVMSTLPYLYNNSSNGNT